MGFARVNSAQSALPHAHTVHVEADVAKGLHQFSIVGLPDKAVEEARDRVASAIKNSGFKSPKHSNLKIVISLAPAALKKEGAAFDLPIALAYLLASEEVACDVGKYLFVGELTLDGTLRPIPGAITVAMRAKLDGFTHLIVPEANGSEASLVPDITVLTAQSLREVIDHITQPEEHPLRINTHTPEVLSDTLSSFDDIRGQESAKRALTIAAAGGHNIALYGPPGTGKTMLARALSSLLPPLHHEAVLEVTAIHSIVDAGKQRIHYHPPFRSPHHTTSYAAMIGGGTIPRPGEVTLAHHGVLFLDEFPEFHRDVINALREPLEDRVVSVSRARGSHLFPAEFILIAALNPCPCGFAGTSRCTCMPHTIERYQRKVSGPIADRIDMWIYVGEIPPESLSVHHKEKPRHESTTTRAAIVRARERQRVRFAPANPSTQLNAAMNARSIEAYAQLSQEAEQVLTHAARTLQLSSRGYHRTIKLARTIADLAENASIEPPHMLEALQYRQQTH